MSVLAAVGLLAATTASASAASGAVKPSPPPSVAHGAAAGKIAAPSAGGALRARGAMQTALQHARQTRHTVPVPAMTTQTSTTVANPDGTFTSTTYVMPVRVSEHGTWAPVNATLRRNANGTYSPAATPSGLTLSGGGSGPLVVMTRPSGASLALTFPFRLPAPVVSGATATYRAVLPGVDLVVTVTDQGAFSDVLVVHDAAAAAALRPVRIRTVTRGLTVRADRYGNVTAVGAGGAVAFVAPVPRMWDSAAPSAATAHVADIGVAAGGGALVLTPDARMLAARSTVYPVYIDPAVNPASSGTTGFVEIQHGTGSDGSDCANAKNWNNTSTAPLGIGFQNYPGTTCQGIYRSYFQIDTHNLNSSMHITRATLLTAEKWASDLACSHTWPVTLKVTGPIGSGTDGYNQPVVNATLATMYPKSAATGCGTQDVNFDVTANMQNTAANNIKTWTFGLFGDEANLPDSSCAPSSSYNCGFMRFADNPSITTVFDIAPNAPANLTTTPVPRDANGTADPGCNLSGNYGWIGRTDIGAGNGSSLTLDATVASNVVGENVRAQWTVFDNSAPDNPAGSDVVATPDSAYVPSGTTVDTPVGIALRDGHQYGIRAWAYDGTLLSAASSGDCHFNVDLTPPTVPVITSTDFPPSGNATPTSLRVGQQGTFSVSSTDPVPTTCVSTCMASGVAKFEYSFNTPVPAAGAATVPPGTPISFTPTQWGTNIVYVDAVDNAGNRSQVAQYDFYVPWNQAATVTAGDINGDRVPDLLVPNAAGDLLLYPGNTDPAVPPVTAGTTATGPDYPNVTDWNTYQITHRGSMQQQAVDDLFAHKGPKLYLYLNGGGTSGQFKNTANIDTLVKPACTATVDNADNCATYPAKDWSAVTQILAPGDAYQGGSLDNGQPSLLTVENDQLWLYQGGYGDNLQDPVLIGISGWSKMTLIGPGKVGGVLSLWARDTTTGDLYSYPLTLDANGFPASLGPATGTGSTGTLIANVNLPAGTYPTLVSPGDLTGSGYPGLYAEDASGNLWYYLGQSTAGGASPLTGTRNLIGMPGATPGSVFVPVTPVRIMDTRSGSQIGPVTGPVAANSTITLPVDGTASLPASGVTAVVVSVTVTNQSQSGFVTVYPADTPVPATSTVDFAANGTTTNNTIVPVGPNGDIAIYNSPASSIQVVIDLTGYFTTNKAAAGASTYTPLAAPNRILDTRNGIGAPKAEIAAHTTLTLTMAGDGTNGADIPSDVTAVALNLTVVPTVSGSAGLLSAYPDGVTKPATSNLWYNFGQVQAATVIIPVGGDGKIDIYNNSASAINLIGDLSGYFTTSATGQYYHPLDGTRIVDTRNGAALAGAGSMTIGVPASILADNPALILNITVAVPVDAGDLSVYPSSVPAPATSILNFAVSETVANLALVNTSDTDSFSIANQSAGTVEVIVDANGYFS